MSNPNPYDEVEKDKKIQDYSVKTLEHVFVNNLWKELASGTIKASFGPHPMHPLTKVYVSITKELDVADVKLYLASQLSQMGDGHGH